MVQPLWASCVTAWLCLLWKFLLASLNFSLFNLWQWSIILPLCTTKNNLAFIFCVLKSKTYYYFMWPFVYQSYKFHPTTPGGHLWVVNVSSFKVPLAGFLMRLLIAAQSPSVHLPLELPCDLVHGQFEPAIFSPLIWLIFPMFALTSLSLTLQISLFVFKSHFPYNLLPTSELYLSGQMSVPTRFCFVFLCPPQPQLPA